MAQTKKPQQLDWMVWVKDVQNTMPKARDLPNGTRLDFTLFSQVLIGELL